MNGVCRHATYYLLQVEGRCSDVCAKKANDEVVSMKSRQRRAGRAEAQAGAGENGSEQAGAKTPRMQKKHGRDSTTVQLRGDLTVSVSRLLFVIFVTSRVNLTKKTHNHLVSSQ